MQPGISIRFLSMADFLLQKSVMSEINKVPKYARYTELRGFYMAYILLLFWEKPRYSWNSYNVQP